MSSLTFVSVLAVYLFNLTFQIVSDLIQLIIGNICVYAHMHPCMYQIPSPQRIFRKCKFSFDLFVMPLDCSLRNQLKTSVLCFSALSLTSAYQTCTSLGIRSLNSYCLIQANSVFIRNMTALSAPITRN